MAIKVCKNCKAGSILTRRVEMRTLLKYGLDKSAVHEIPAWEPCPAAEEA